MKDIFVEFYCKNGGKMKKKKLKKRKTVEFPTRTSTAFVN